MARLTVDAHLSANRKYAICGNCGRSLCRRDQVDGLTIEGDSRLHHELTWDADWYVVDDHIERSASALHRLSQGDAPVRSPTIRHPDWRGPKQSLSFPGYPPALCPWAVCDALNLIDPRRLNVR